MFSGARSSSSGVGTDAGPDRAIHEIIAILATFRRQTGQDFMLAGM